MRCLGCAGQSPVPGGVRLFCTGRGCTTKGGGPKRDDGSIDVMFAYFIVGLVFPNTFSRWL